MIKKISTTFIFIVAFFLLSNSTYASGFNLSIDPAVIKIQIKPGKSITKAYKIENKSDQDQLLIARIVPFTKSDLFGNPELDLKNQPAWLRYFSLSNSNIKLNEPFTLKAKSTDQLILSVSVPEDALLKDIYLNLLVSNYESSPSAEQKGSLVNGSIGANILLSVTSELNPKTIIKIENFKIASGQYLRIGSLYLIDNLSTLTFEANAKNDGNFISEIRGLFKITHNGNPIFISSILPQNVISRNSRKITPNKDQSFLFAPEIFQVGQFQAVFEIHSENGDSQNSINLFLFPFKAIIGVIITISLFYILKKR